MLKGSSIQEFHHEEGAAVLLADVINGADVGVIQGGSGPRLPLETCERLRVVSDFVRQKLQGHEPVQSDVLGLVNHAHSATTQLLDDAVMGDGLADKGTTAIWRLFALLKSEGACRRAYSRVLQEASSLLL